MQARWAVLVVVGLVGSLGCPAAVAQSGSGPGTGPPAGITSIPMGSLRLREMVPAEATPTDPPGPPPTSPGGPGPFGAQLFGTTGTAAPQPVLECEGTEAPAPSPPKQRFHLEAGWDNGLHLDSEDDRFHLHVGGNAQVDSTWLIGPKGAFAIPGGGMNGVENASATFVRRARLRMDGDIFGQFDYVVEIDFANADNDNDSIQPPSFGNLNASPSLKNVWMQIREVPILGNVRFGYQVKPL